MANMLFITHRQQYCKVLNHKAPKFTLHTLHPKVFIYYTMALGLCSPEAQRLTILEIFMIIIRDIYCYYYNTSIQSKVLER